MKFIELDEKKCDECYKCLRVCPTKAIVFTDSRRDIVDEMCIKCGVCQASCPQEALSIQNDKYKIKKNLQLGKKIVISLAPSYVAAFNTDQPKKIITALRQLGIHWIEETSVAAEIVSQAYEKQIQLDPKKNILTTCCPSANYLVQYYHPELLDYMLPIDSPMIAHGKMLKEKFKSDCYVVFIGPCLAKKAEAEAKGYIDAVLTFNELLEWLNESHIDYQNLPSGTFDADSTIRGMAYPVGGSLFQNDRITPINSQYNLLRVDGIERCKDLLDTLENNGIQNYCIEMNICHGSCVNGPDMPHDGQTYYQRKDRMLHYLKQHDSQKTLSAILQEKTQKLSFAQIFESKPTVLKHPNAEEVRQILRQIDKYSEKDELNCGSCGYDSCKDKAIAVFNNLSKPQMCLPYLRSKAENLSSAIFEFTPNLVCVLDHDLNIIDYNPIFDSIFNINHNSLKGMPIAAFMQENLFMQCLEDKTSIIGQREHIIGIEKVFLCNAVYTERFILSVMTDITQSEKSRQELAKVKEKTLMTCQEVINKQMRVAQEIASLLGETTAETKVNLNRLKEIVLLDEGY